MSSKISDEIDEDISLYLEHLNNKKKFKLINPGHGVIDDDIVVVMDLFSYKLTVRDIDYVLSYDPSADTLTFTTYVSDGGNYNFSQRYYRKKYYNIQRYIDDEYFLFQQSTIDKLLFTHKQLIELKELYQYYKTKLAVDFFDE